MSRVSAIVLGAGSGKRMGTAVPKQYLPLGGKPVLYYALAAFDKSQVDEIVLVVAPGEIAYCKKEIVEKYHIEKVSAIVEGGAERYDSVYEGIKVATGDYVLIHDGARAFLTEEVIARCIAAVEEYPACVVGVPTKDTVKVCDIHGMVVDTPERSNIWMVQTPQCFSRQLIYDAYSKMYTVGTDGITDDAMVVERMTDVAVQMIMGDYNNIKLTTPEDMAVGEQILRQLHL